MKSAKHILADNLRSLIGGGDSQRAREDLARKSEVSPRTIGNMLSRTAGNPTLDNIEAVAKAKGLTVAELLSENLGKGGKSERNNESPQEIREESAPYDATQFPEPSALAERLQRIPMDESDRLWLADALDIIERKASWQLSPLADTKEAPHRAESTLGPAPKKRPGEVMSSDDDAKKSPRKRA